MMTRKRFGFVSAGVGMVAALAMSIAAVNVAATPQKTTTVKLAMSPYQDVTSIHVGIRKGFFKSAGIELKIQNAGGWNASNELLVGGGADIGTSCDFDIIPQNAKKQDTTLAFPLYLAALEALMFFPKDHPDWKTYNQFLKQTGNKVSALRQTFAQVKGAKIALPPNDPTMLLMIKKAGFKTSDFNIIILDETNMPPALINGSVDLMRGGIPQRIAVARQGARALVDQRVAPETLIHCGYSAHRSWINSHRAVARAFLRAMFKTQRYIVAHKKQSFEIISQELRKQGTQLSAADLAAVWNVMEFFPTSAAQYKRDYIAPTGRYYWRKRWQFVLQGYQADGTVPKSFKTPLADLLYAVRLVKEIS
jgi:NitT/TauT family transport system substrate-binding protein